MIARVLVGLLTASLRAQAPHLFDGELAARTIAEVIAQEW